MFTSLYQENITVFCFSCADFLYMIFPFHLPFKALVSVIKLFILQISTTQSTLCSSSYETTHI